MDIGWTDELQERLDRVYAPLKVVPREYRYVPMKHYGAGLLDLRTTLAMYKEYSKQENRKKDLREFCEEYMEKQSKVGHRNGEAL